MRHDTIRPDPAQLDTRSFLKRLTVLAALTLPAISPLGAQEGGQDGPPPAPVEVAHAEERQMATRLWVPGTVVSRQDAGISAEIAGRLIWVAEVGDTLAEGGTLARIDDSELRLQLREGEATLRRLEASLEFLDQQVARQRRLSEEGIVASQDLERIEAQRRTAREQLEESRASLDRTRYRLDHTAIRAPYPGRVVERHRSPGAHVSVGEEVVRLVDTRTVEVRARAPLSVASFLTEGQTVAVDDRVHSTRGTVRALVPVGDERSRMFEVRVALPRDPSGTAWVVGGAVRVALPAGEPRRVTAVPRDALVLRREAIYLYKVNGDGAAERVEVEVGTGEGPLVEVLGPITPGETVIVRGAERLLPGQAIKVLVKGDEAPKPATASAG